MIKEENGNMNANCTVCLECLKYPIGRPDSCEHKFCFECISNWLKRRSQCPLCGRVPKYLIKIDESKRETKVAVKKRTAKQFENELIVRDQLEEGDSDPLADDITVTYASCRVCKRSDNEHLLLLCDGNVGRNSDGSMIRCNVAYHSYCLPEKLYYIPKDDWFCPFCINKPENFINSSSKVGTSNFTRSKKNQIEDTYQNLETHLNENSKQSSGTKMKCSSTANSGSAIADHHTASGDSDAEPESNKSDESSEIYSVADESSDNYDDEYEGDDTEMIMESSSELSVDGSETEDTNELSSDALDNVDEIDLEESDESDSSHGLNKSMNLHGSRQRGMNYCCGKTNCQNYATKPKLKSKFRKRMSTT